MASREPAEAVPVLPTSWGKAGRLAWWPQGAPDWKSELGSRPVSATHKFHGPGPVFLEPYGQSGDFSVPGQKMGTTAFKARSRRSHITKAVYKYHQAWGRGLAQMFTPPLPELCPLTLPSHLLCLYSVISSSHIAHRRLARA